MDQNCEHIRHIHVVTPGANGCEECLKMGDGWVHLRLCETCGHVGCCDDSKNKHASQHSHLTGRSIHLPASPTRFSPFRISALGCSLAAFCMNID
jgi:hypothetical protein